MKIIDGQLLFWLGRTPDDDGRLKIEGHAIRVLNCGGGQGLGFGITRTGFATLNTRLGGFEGAFWRTASIRRQASDA
jgi:hypothetical protein